MDQSTSTISPAGGVRRSTGALSHIARSSLIIAVFFGIDKVLGFVRQALFSFQFTPDELDIFLASNNIPDLLSALISGGALGIALIPVLSGYLQRSDRREAWNLFSQIANLAFVVTAGISLVIILLAGPLVRNVTAPGFDPAKQELTAALMSLDLAAILIFSISGLVMAGLQANQHFLLPAMAPALYNLGQIFGVAVLAPETGLRLGPVTLPAFGLGLYGLVYGVILGALLHLAIQVPGLLRFGFRWTPRIQLRDPGVQKVLRLMGPRLLTMLVLHIYFLSRDNLASHMEQGSVTVLNYGWFIMQMPETLIGTAIAIALLPSISEQVAAGGPQALRDTVNQALRVMLALTLPVAALLAVTIRPLVEFAFNFDPRSTELLAWATRLFLLGLLGHTWLEVAVRSFYAQQNALTPFLAACVQITAYLVLANLLSASMGVAGLALADTLAFTGQAILLLVLLNRRVAGVLNIGGTLLRAVLGAAAGALVATLVYNFLPLPAILLALGALAAGGLVALPFIWPELKLLIKL
jgi:putative peptidoglycan lipid II flippase